MKFFDKVFLIALLVVLVLAVFLELAVKMSEKSDKFLVDSLNKWGAESILNFKIADTNGSFVEVDATTTRALFDLFKDSKQPTNCYLGDGTKYSIKLKMTNGSTYNNLEFVYNTNCKIFAIGLPPKWYGLVGNEENYFGCVLTNITQVEQTLERMVRHLNIHNFH